MSDESAPEQRAYAGPATKRGFAEWCMFLAVGTPSRLWKHTPKSFEDGRKLTVNVAILGVGILLAIVLVKSTLETTTIVEPAAVPQALVDRGYTGTIIAQRLIDQVDVIDKTAKTSKEHIQFAHESRFAALSTLQVPAAGVTVQSVVTILRNLLRREDDRIGSELTIKPPTGGSKTETYELLLRFEIGSERFVIVVASPDVDQLIRRGSQAIVGKRDPYTLASYLYGRREWLQVDTLLDQLVVAADLKDRKWALNLRGLRYADHGDYEEALRYYKKATDLDPDFAVALTNSGNALSSLGRRSEALKTYHAAIAKNPRLAQARVGLAITLARDDLPAAFTLLQEAIEQNPREPLPYNVRGNLERDQGNFKSAFENYGTAVGLDPEYALAYNGWGIAMYRNGDPEGALKMYAKAIEADPRTPHPHYNAARILSERKELDKAIQSYRQATEVDSEYVLGFRALGEAFEGKGDYAAAMKYYKRVVGLSFDPSYWPSKVEQMITFLTGSGLPY